MAPIKLENHIKERLEEREIVPSNSAWEQIAANLDVKASKKQSRKRLWFAIAASFVGGLFIASIFFKPSKEVFPSVKVVSNQEHKGFEEHNTIDQKQTINYDRSVDKKDAFKNVIDTQQQNSIAYKGINENKLNKNVDINVEDAIREVIENELKLSSVIQSEIDIANYDTIRLDKNSVIDLAALDEKLKVQTSIYEVTEVEVEALLLAAQQQVQQGKRYVQRTNLIDANDLLLDAEAEVDPGTFKDRIFKTIKSGLEEVVEAIVDENN